jgi:hypothetical protein
VALIVEDGSGVTGAESYITVAGADTYFSDRGNAMWDALTTEQKEQALRKGTDYMEGRYRWRGERVADDQALSWPRTCVYAFGHLVDSDVVPERVQRACAELAVRASADDLSPDVGAQVKSETVGPISVTYADGARQTTAYKLVDAMLSPYVYGMGSIPVSRA